MTLPPIPYITRYNMCPTHECLYISTTFRVHTSSARVRSRHKVLEASMEDRRDHYDALDIIICDLHPPKPGQIALHRAQRIHNPNVENMNQPNELVSTHPVIFRHRTAYQIIPSLGEWHAFLSQRSPFLFGRYCCGDQNNAPITLRVL